MEATALPPVAEWQGTKVASGDRRWSAQATMGACSELCLVTGFRDCVVKATCVAGTVAATAGHEQVSKSCAWLTPTLLLLRNTKGCEGCTSASCGC